MQDINVHNRSIGTDQPCFLVAEVGINHNGDLALARRTIDAAADSGADAVKFQNYRTDDFITDRSLTHEYVSQGNRIVESQFEMFKRCELAPGALSDLANHACKRGLIFFTTPTGQSTLEEALAAKVPLLKNGSDYLTHLPLIRAMARSGVPTILSTGMATLGEIDDAVRAFREAGGCNLILLHCTSSYPAPPESIHLRKIRSLAQAFGCPVGLSDHSEGIVAALGAIVMGAVLIEKHFTLDRQLPGPDHSFSSDPAEFAALVKGVRTIEQCLGQSALGPTPAEWKSRNDYRLSCVAALDLPAGHQLTLVDLAFRRPGGGFPPGSAPSIVGRKLRRKVVQGKLLVPDDFD